MERLVRTAAAQILKSPAAVVPAAARLRAYSDKHPMWRVLVCSDIRLGYDTIQAVAARSVAS